MNSNHPFANARINFLVCLLSSWSGAVTMLSVPSSRTNFGKKTSGVLTSLQKNTELAIIHIPLEDQNRFNDAILKLMSPHTDAKTASSVPEPYPHPFTIVSVTPYECSIACPRDMVMELFVPIQASKKEIVVSDLGYLAIVVEGMGYESAERIAELTAPLAVSGV